MPAWPERTLPVSLTRLLRHAAARRHARQARALRRKAGHARQVVADTDAMLDRHHNPPRRNP